MEHLSEWRSAPRAAEQLGLVAVQVAGEAMDSEVAVEQAMGSGAEGFQETVEDSVDWMGLEVQMAVVKAVAASLRAMDGAREARQCVLR